VGLLCLVLALPCPCLAHGADREAPWIFFDLGKTLIDHKKDFSEMRYLPGAHAYLKNLKASGFHLGILLNWPENEGTGNAEKLRLLKEYVAARWTDQEPPDWDLFDAVLFPPKDEYRKPHPFLFIEALRTAAPQAALYQGEDPEENRVARSLGLAAHCISNSKGDRLPLLPPQQFSATIRDTFIYQHPGSGR